jgi:GDP-4-dehydro-6-deoxy-D-mannose reductase
MKVLLTGAGGFLGNAVAEALIERDHEVAGIGVTGRGGWPAVDLTDPEAAARVVGDSEPEAVIHLAGQPSAAESRREPMEAFLANTATTWNLLEAVSRLAPDALFLLGSSAAVYGRPDPALAGRVPEGAPIEPDSIYGASKAAAEMVSGSYAASASPAVAIARIFNLVGPGQRQGVAGDLVAVHKQGQEVRQAVRNPLSVRDFTDARDAARAIVAMAEAGVTGTYNLCSGNGVEIAELGRLIAGEGDRPSPPATSPPKGGPDVLVGDPSRLRKKIDWEPRIPLKKSIEDLLAGE